MVLIIEKYINCRQFIFSFNKLLIPALIICLASCKKQDDTVSFDSQPAESEIDMIMAFDDVEYITYEGMELSNNIMEGRIMHDEGPLGSACVSYAFSNQQNTTTITFGAGCLGPEGKVREGTIIISQTGKFFEPGTVITSIMENYSVNGVKLTGTLTITNISPERTNTPDFELSLENGKAVWPDQTFATREINYVRSWKRAANHQDIEYFVTGSAQGIRRNGGTYFSQISNSLNYKWLCLDSHKYLPVQGIFSVTLENENVYSVDYGTGTCDDKVQITYNEMSKVISPY